MRVRGDAPVLWRTTGQTQIGVEPGRSLVLTGLTAAEQQLLDHLPRRMSPDDVYRASRRCRVPLPRAQDLLGRLRAEGVLRGGGSRPTTPEEQYWERLVHSPRSRAVRLRAKRVALFGSGPLAHELAALLAEAGLGAVLPEDEAVGAQIVARFPGTDTGAPLDTIPDLTLTLDPHVIDPVRARALAQAGARHLPVTLREVSVRVGPLFEPDRPVCHDCLDLWEADADACWPAIATQARLLPEPVLERLLLHQCAALAVRAALDCLGDAPDRWRAASTELSADEPLGVARRWSPHPRCLCSQTSRTSRTAGAPRAIGDTRSTRTPRSARASQAPRSSRTAPRAAERPDAAAVDVDVADAAGVDIAVADAAPATPRAPARSAAVGPRTPGA